MIAVHDTAASDQFAKVVQGIRKGKKLLIADEVHNLGAGQLRKALRKDFEFRLGLSATPQRWFDDDGTRFLSDFFEGICFSYPIETAIGKFLVPYDYNPIVINLQPDEQEQYDFLSQKIGVLISKEDRILEDQRRLKMLLIQRSAVISSARNKLTCLISMLKDRMKSGSLSRADIKHTLVYCGPGQHLNALREIAALGIRCHEFVHTVPLSERSRLLKQFDDGDIDVLVAVKCLDEGVDIPSTQSAYFLSSTTNPREFVQRRGRILRCFKDKDKAKVFDFLTFPDKKYWPMKRDVDKGLLRREMPRFAEFASIATNRFEARQQVWDILDSYEMLNLLDEKPWDIYHKLKECTEFLEASFTIE
jgi:superfamily II DNA or RNA helicase